MIARARRQDHQLLLAGGSPRRRFGRDLLRLQAAVLSITQSAGLISSSTISTSTASRRRRRYANVDQVDALFAKYENRPSARRSGSSRGGAFGRMACDRFRRGCRVSRSSDADYVVAQTLNVDGGNWMS